MPEESMSNPGPNDPNRDALRSLERRLESLELAAQKENRYWRGGLIAALVLVALSILIAHHQHRPPPPFMMSRMSEMGPRMMPYGPPPPYWGYGSGPQGGYGYYGGPGEWHHHHHEDGPGPEGEPPSPKG